MSELDAFLAAVADNPADDNPRLIFADWLEEHDHPERAELIRAQVELARDWHDHSDLSHQGTKLCRGCVLRRREQELLKSHVGAWTDFLPECLVTTECLNCVDQAADWETGVVECRQCDSIGIVPNYDHVEFSRGFLSGIDCTWEEWREHGDAILADPWVPGLDEVELTTGIWPVNENYLRGVWPTVRKWTLPP